MIYGSYVGWHIAKGHPVAITRYLDGTFADLAGVPLADQNEVRPLTELERRTWKEKYAGFPYFVYIGSRTRRQVLNEDCKWFVLVVFFMGICSLAAAAL